MASSGRKVYERIADIPAALRIVPEYPLPVSCRSPAATGRAIGRDLFAVFSECFRPVLSATCFPAEHRPVEGVARELTYVAWFARQWHRHRSVHRFPLPLRQRLDPLRPLLLRPPHSAPMNSNLCPCGRRTNTAPPRTLSSLHNSQQILSIEGRGTRVPSVAVPYRILLSSPSRPICRIRLECRSPADTSIEADESTSIRDSFRSPASSLPS